VKRSVSIVYEKEVQNWAVNGNSGHVALERTLISPFQTFSQPMLRMVNACTKFMCDYYHFSGTNERRVIAFDVELLDSLTLLNSSLPSLGLLGNTKPWMRAPPMDISEKTKFKNSLYLWWYYLQKIDKEVQLGLDFVHWDEEGQHPPLGLFATWGDVRKSMKEPKTEKT
jgi:hypothetical protein